MEPRLNVPGRVSVVVNCYNDEDYIPTCLDSLINQTYEDLEIVVVDGNSSDHTVEISRDILSKSGRKYLMYSTNGPERYTPLGIMWGYLIGAGNSTGEYLSFHGSDDLSNKYRFQLMVDAIGDNVMAYSSLMYVNNNLDIIGRGNGDSNDAIYQSVMKGDPIPIHLTGFTTMFKKWAYFKEQSYIVGSYFWECAHTLKLYALGDFIYVPDAIYFFRNSPRQGESASSSYTRTEVQGYDYNELHFGKYNYAIDSVMRKKLAEEGINDCNDDEHWSKYLGLHIAEWKRRARMRLEGRNET